jgi:hypothetical protein
MIKTMLGRRCCDALAGNDEPANVRRRRARKFTDEKRLLIITMLVSIERLP